MIINLIKFYWREWKYYRLPLNKKKNTIRYKIEHCEKDNEGNVIYIDPGIYSEDIKLMSGLTISGFHDN